MLQGAYDGPISRGGVISGDRGPSAIFNNISRTIQICWIHHRTDHNVVEIDICSENRSQKVAGAMLVAGCPFNH